MCCNAVCPGKRLFLQSQISRLVMVIKKHGSAVVEFTNMISALSCGGERRRVTFCGGLGSKSGEHWVLLELILNNFSKWVKKLSF